jgi:hypothetical protein
MNYSLILDIVTTSAVLLGIIFGLLQLRHFHISQEREADLLLLNSLRTGELFHGLWVIQGIPTGLTKGEIETRYADDMKWVYQAMRTWELFGALVFNREIPIEIIEQAFDDPILQSWEKLEKYVNELRDELQRERLFEWFQWLAERIAAREGESTRKPAPSAFQDWK